jgi:hypothetical protein
MHAVTAPGAVAAFFLKEKDLFRHKFVPGISFFQTQVFSDQKFFQTIDLIQIISFFRS